MSGFFISNREAQQAREDAWSFEPRERGGFFDDPDGDGGIFENARASIGAGFARGGEGANDFMRLRWLRENSFGIGRASGIALDAVLPDAPTAWETFFTENRDDWAQVRRAYTVDPSTRSDAANLIGDLSGVLTTFFASAAAGGPAGFATGPVFSGFGFAREEEERLLEMGADAPTARGGGTYTGWMMGLMGAAPVAVPGRLMTRVASGAGINLAFGGALRGGMNAYLTEQGYGEGSDNNIAQYYNWLDPHAATIDAVLGAAFGGIFGRRPAPQGFRPRPSEGEPAAEPAPPELPPDAEGFFEEARQYANDEMFAEAYAYALLARELGHPEADGLLALLDQDATPEQVGQGRALAEEIIADENARQSARDNLVAPALVEADSINRSTVFGIPENQASRQWQSEALAHIEGQALRDEPIDPGPPPDDVGFVDLEDVERMASEIEYSRRTLSDRPSGLLEFVRRQGEIRDDRGRVVQRGGISDDRGDIAAAINDGRKGFASVLSPNGRPIDYVIEQAVAEGFFPEYTDGALPDQRTFLDALERDARDPGSVTNDLEAAFNVRNARDILNYYESRGIDTGLEGQALRSAVREISAAAHWEMALEAFEAEARTEGLDDLAAQIRQMREENPEAFGPDDVLYSRRPYKKMADYVDRAEPLLRAGVSMAETARRLGVEPKSLSTAVNARIASGEMAPIDLRHGRSGLRGDYDEADLINAVLVRDEEGRLISRQGAAMDLRGDDADVAAFNVQYYRLRNEAREAIAAGDAAVERLAALWNVTPERLREFVATEAERRGPMPLGAIADELIAEGVTDPPTMRKRLREIAEARGDNPSEGSIKAIVSQARRRAGLTPVSRGTNPDNGQAVNAEQDGTGARTGDVLFSMGRDDRPIFYSAVERALENSTTQRASGAQWWATISKAQGVKKEELQWIGLEDWLKAREGQISRDEVLTFVRENGVRVEETVLGDAVGNAELAARWLQENVGQEQTDQSWGYSHPGNYVERAQAEIQRRVLPLIEERDRLAHEKREILNRTNDATAERDDARIQEINTRIDDIDPQIFALQEASSEIGMRLERSRWSQFQLPGGENYREVLLRLPTMASRYNEAIAAVRAKYNLGPGEGWGSRVTPEERAQIERYQVEEETTFRSSHFDQPNILAHVRFNERTDANGKRTLFIEEVQSDWHQAGRERGYKGGADIQAIEAKLRDAGVSQEAIDSLRRQQNPPDAAWTPPEVIETIRKTLSPEELARFRAETGTQVVPDAPFKNNAWASLALKRMIRWAAENGFEQIAWTRGQQQIERFNLAHHMGNIEGVRIKDRVSFTPSNGRRDARQALQNFGEAGSSGNTLMTREQAMEAFGKEAGARLFDTAFAKNGEVHTFYQEDLYVGGEGMRAFYDRILPNIANDLGKKFGARVGEAEVGVGDGADAVAARGEMDEDYVYTEADKAQRFESVHSLPITPEMREAALEGMPLFSQRGTTGRSSVAELRARAEQELGADWGALERASLAKLAEDFASLPPEARRAANATFIREALRLGMTDDAQIAAYVARRAGDVTAFVWNGRAYFVANRISVEEFLAKVLHEIGVHHELESLVGKRGMTEINRHIARLIDEKHPIVIEAMNDAMFYSGIDNISKEGVAYTVERATLARLIESRPDLPLVQQVLARVRQWLIKTFGSTFGMRLTVDDLRALALSSLRRAAEQARREAIDAEALAYADSANILASMDGRQNDPDLVGNRRDPIESPDYQRRIAELRGEDRGAAGGPESVGGVRQDAGAGDRPARSDARARAQSQSGVRGELGAVIEASGIRLTTKKAQSDFGAYRAEIDTPFASDADTALQAGTGADGGPTRIDFDLIDGSNPKETRLPGVHLKITRVNDALKGQGVGVWLYRQLVDWADRRGLPVYSDFTVSAEAQRIYDALERRGYRVERINAAARDEDGALVNTRFQPIFRISRTGVEAEYDAAPPPREDYQIDGESLRDRQARIDEARQRQEEYDALSPVDLAVRDAPDEILFSFGKDRPLTAREALDQSRQESEAASTMRKGFEAAARCGARHGAGALAGASFITMNAGGTSAALGQALGLVLAIPAGMIAAPLIANAAPSPSYRRRRSQEAGRAAGLDNPAEIEPTADRIGMGWTPPYGPITEDGPLPGETPVTPQEDFDSPGYSEPLSDRVEPNPGEPPGPVMRGGRPVSAGRLKVPPAPPSALQQEEPDPQEGQDLIDLFRPIIEGET